VTLTRNNTICSKTFGNQPNALQMVLPEFKSDSSLSNLNYILKITTPTSTYPSTGSLVGQQPVQIFASPTQVKQWTRQTPMGAFNDIVTLETESNGRVVSELSQTTSQTGLSGSLHWHLNGSLIVYQTSTLPSDLFTLKQGAPSCELHVGLGKTSYNLSHLNRPRPLIYPDPTKLCNAKSITGDYSVTISWNNCEWVVDPNSQTCASFSGHDCWVGYVNPLTTSSTVYVLSGGATGYDRCESAPWREDFSNQSYQYNTTSAPTSNDAGGFQTCSISHSYEVDFANYYAKYSAPPSQLDWQGETDYFTFAPPPNY
jgi:hypothetical protein